MPAMSNPTRLRFIHTGNPTGLKFAVEHGDARCLFDFGREHAPGRAAFSIGLEPRPGRELADLLALGEAPPLDGVYAGQPWDGRTHLFLTHMHLDHVGLLPFLGPDVPLYFPDGMEDLRQAVDASGYLRWRRPPGFRVADGLTVPVGPISVRFAAVDHDLPGATGFIITTPDCTIAFTGDHRWHGLHPEKTAAFADLARGADLLIQEGVALGYVAPDPSPVERSEADVIAELGQAVAEAPGLVIINCYGMNRERVAGLAAGCAAAGRKLLMEPQTAAIAGWPGVLGDLDAIRADPRGHCLQLGYEGLPRLIDIQPAPGTLYIHSGGVPLGRYDPSWGVMEAWIAHFRLELRFINTSGHSRPADIERMVRTVAPRAVLPVHSLAPEALQVPGVPSFIPEAGVDYEVAAITGSRS
ncbi:MAG: MBL fold metallo-hydrolase [Candidatus Dormibacteraceae bacterium]